MLSSVQPHIVKIVNLFILYFQKNRRILPWAITNCCIRGWIPLHIPNPDPTENNSFEIFETSGGLRRGEAVWLEAGGRGEGTGEIFNKKILFMILEQFKKIFTILFFLILGRKNDFLWYTCFMILFFTDTFFYDTLHVS